MTPVDGILLLFFIALTITIGVRFVLDRKIDDLAKKTAGSLDYVYQRINAVDSRVNRLADKDTPNARTYLTFREAPKKSTGARKTTKKAK